MNYTQEKYIRVSIFLREHTLRGSTDRLPVVGRHVVRLVPDIKRAVARPSFFDGKIT